MRPLVPLLLLLPAACDRGERPEAPTAAENAQLDDAEAMLDGLANEEGPADRSTGPSNSQ